MRLIKTAQNLPDSSVLLTSKYTGWLTSFIDLRMTARTDKCMGYAIFLGIAAKMQAKHLMLGIKFINQERGIVNPF